MGDTVYKKTYKFIQRLRSYISCSSFQVKQIILTVETGATLSSSLLC